MSSTQFEEGFIPLDSTIGNYIVHDCVAALKVRASLNFEEPLVLLNPYTPNHRTC
jgi:hypothetical protein